MKNFREIIGGLIFWLFLKVVGSTPEEFWEEIYQQEKNYKKRTDQPL